jgi:methylmalonyl-CoA carboxyltransferase large subunit
MAKITMKDLAEALEKVQLELASLKPPAANEAMAEPEVKEPAPPPEPPKPEITEEELIAISAALGAYLGIRIRIKQIRLLGSHAWAQQGRVSIQASHNLHN